MNKMLLLTTWTTFYLMIIQSVSASIYDCWDPQKLSRMTFPLSNQEANDPNLGKFSKLLKCLMGEQSKAPGGLNNMDWSQWQNVAGTGQFPQGWNNQPGWTRPGVNNNNNNNMINPNNQNTQWASSGGIPQQGQPRPGVHPDDWDSNNGINPNMQQPGNWPPNQMPPPQGPPPQQPPSGWNNNNNNNNMDNNMNNNNRRRNKNNQNNRRNNERPPPPPPPPGSSMMPMMPPVMDGGPVPGSNNWNTNMGARETEESKTESKNRQYGYAVMACAVVVLAVVMVSAIFCCNSSNSTMNQPATVNVNPPDTFSIYSYKQPVIGSDTLRSGALGDTLRTETLRSTASPQYRVSDIDPDFARRFREEHY